MQNVPDGSSRPLVPSLFRPRSSASPVRSSSSAQVPFTLDRELVSTISGAGPRPRQPLPVRDPSDGWRLSGRRAAWNATRKVWRLKSTPFEGRRPDLPVDRRWSPTEKGAAEALRLQRFFLLPPLWEFMNPLLILEVRLTSSASAFPSSQSSTTIRKMGFDLTTSQTQGPACSGTDEDNPVVPRRFTGLRTALRPGIPDGPGTQVGANIRRPGVRPEALRMRNVNAPTTLDERLKKDRP